MDQVTKSNPFAGYEVPEPIRERVLAILTRFTIRGICDGMYIANVIAHRTGHGDGEGHFDGVPEFTLQQCVDLAADLRFAYGHNIARKDMDELCEILKTGQLDVSKTRKGIEDYISELRVEIPAADDWRKEYLKKTIIEAEETLIGLSA